MGELLSRRAVAAALLVGATLVHVPTWPASFCFDDDRFVVQNQSVRSVGAALAAFDQPFPPQAPQRGLYRPLTNLSYALDHALWGMNAWGFHLSNWALYAACVLAVAALARRLRASAGFAFATGVLFAVHPVHTEAVDSIAGRSELLALGLTLASLLAFVEARKAAKRQHSEAQPSEARTPAKKGMGMRAKPEWLWLAASLVAYAGACLSKETGVVVPGLIVAWLVACDASDAPQRLRRGLAWTAPYLAIAAGYLALRLHVLGRFSPDAAILAGTGAWARLSTAGAVFTEYARLLVFPHRLQVDFYYQQRIGVQHGGSAAAWLGLAMIAALAGALAFATWRHVRAQRAGRAVSPECATLLFSGALFTSTLLPVSHLFDIGALMAERFLFAPSVGFAFAVTLAGERALAALPLAAPRRAAVAAALVGAVALAGGAGSAFRAAEWRDPVLLWESADRAMADDRRVLVNLGEAYLAAGRYADAERALERALEIAPGHLGAIGNLAQIYWETGRRDAAAAIFDDALARHPNDALTWSNRGVIEARRGNHRGALRYFERALALDSNLAVAVRNQRTSRAALGAQPAEHAAEN